MNKKMKRFAIYTARSALVLYIAALMVIACACWSLPDKITVKENEINKVSASIEGIDGSIEENLTLDAKLFGVIPVKKVELEVVGKNKLVPCGNVFGVKFFTKGVLVIKLSEIECADGLVSPAENAGIAVGDIIVKVNSKEINTVEEMSAEIEKSKGQGIEIVYERQGKTERCELVPVLSLSDRKYKTGIWVRDSTAGIGTMTYYDPETGVFAGLGHGICDVDTGELMPLLRGSVVDVDVTDIIRGRRGMPGELKGDFDSIKRGVLTDNTDVGVYGVMDEMPVPEGEMCEIGLEDEISEGKASILCELDDEGIEEYAVEISEIMNDDGMGKNFVITVTDERLIEKTGGIVQGMRGSPIIQNGKLIGAVTHVLVNNPKKGYGIFIGNMLKNS